jgi:hypothetical protein
MYGGFAMRYPTLVLLAMVSCAALPAKAQTSPSTNLQNEADKGIKTENSGASGYVGAQDKPGSAAHLPGDPNRAESSGAATAAPSAQNSGAGIAGAAGNKNGPAPGQGTVGSASQNPVVQQQDSSNIKGLPGNKSGPPAKR